MRALRVSVLVPLLLILAGCGINNIPTYDESVNAAWAEVQNQYKRRADLVPNLVETVKGFARQEREVLTQVVEARSRVAQMQVPPNIINDPQAMARFEQNQGALSSALARLLVVVERYPELKSNQNFLSLQSQLEGTENRIAIARRDYIQSVQRYNTELRTIPGRWYAALLYPDAKVKANFSQPESVQQAPEVKF
jgi:LemA protein